MRSFFSFALVQKYLLGITGLGLAFFLLIHVLGNALIFMGAKSYNLYAAQLEQNIMIVLEVGLLLLFLTHVVLAVILTIKNFQARGKKYIIKASGDKATAWYHKNLIGQGAIILVFIILHLITFKFGSYYEVTYGDQTVRDLFRVVVEAFQNPINVLWYLVALLVLCVHLFHGVASSFQSFGFNHPLFNKVIKQVSIIYTILVTVGYLSLPIYIFFFINVGAK